MRRTRVGVATLLAALLAGAASPAAADDGAADVCLEVAAGTLSEADWSALIPPVMEAIEARPALYPAPTALFDGSRLGVWTGRAGPAVGNVAPCLEPGSGWSARFGRGNIEAGADQMLAEAPTTPGIDSNVSIEWYPDETRLRTSLVFAGPLDFPNGTCWIDDALSVDDADGTVATSGERGVETSPFAEGACGRFFDHLPDGGAGEQTAMLLPTALDLADGSALRFVVEQVEVRDDGVVLAGSLERD